MTQLMKCSENGPGHTTSYTHSIASTRGGIMRYVLLLAFALMACSDSPTQTAASITGSYVLSSVNGGSLPAVVLQAGADKVEVTSGQVTLNADKTASEQYSYRWTQGGQVTTYGDSGVGTYTHTDGAITIRWASGDIEQGTISGSRMTLFADGITLVYQRR